eukprot:1474821-Rhodomonas_salina.1
MVTVMELTAPGTGVLCPTRSITHFRTWTINGAASPTPPPGVSLNTDAPAACDTAARQPRVALHRGHLHQFRPDLKRGSSHNPSPACALHISCRRVALGQIRCQQGAAGHWADRPLSSHALGADGVAARGLELYHGCRTALDRS